MSTLKYAVLLPITAETGYGTYLLSSSQWGQSSATQQVERATIPKAETPSSSEEDLVLPEQALEQTKEEEVPVEAPVSSEGTQIKAIEPAPIEPKQEAPKVVDQPKAPVTGEGDEMIEAAGEGSIGHKYKESLIGTRRSEAWVGKVDSWKEYNQQNQNDEPFKFREEDFEKLKEQMTSRCEEAYKHKSFRETTVNGQEFNKEKYWAMVWSYCGKPSADYPTGWGGYN